jgi:hypothetical protein
MRAPSTVAEMMASHPAHRVGGEAAVHSAGVVATAANIVKNVLAKFMAGGSYVPKMTLMMCPAASRLRL